MNEERVNSLIDCLFTLIRAFNAVLDRLDVLTEKQGELLNRNEEVFKSACEDFFRRLIEAEVNKGTQKNQQSNERGIKFGSDIVR